MQLSKDLFDSVTKALVCSPPFGPILTEDLGPFKQARSGFL